VSDDPDLIAVKLPFKTGEYFCTWHLTGLDGESLEIPGLLEVEPGHYVRGRIHGPVPIAWKYDGKGSKSAGFPQTHQFTSLNARLSSGAHVTVLNGEVSYWADTQGSVIGALAVMSLHPFGDDGHRKYHSIEFQIEGLESVLEEAPIKETRLPGESGDNTWAATLNPDSSKSWTSPGAELSFTFRGSFRSMDAYEFRMAFAPVVTITLTEPLTVIEWWQRWLLPMRRMISIATAKPRAVISFLAIDGTDDDRVTRDQVFGWHITQKPLNSQSAAIRGIHSTILLNTDELSLLDLATRWGELSDQQHPMVETYGALSTSDEQHPRSRFTLLLQSLEGAYGFENQQTSTIRRDRFAARRASFLDRIAPTLSANDHRFLRKYLMRSPSEGLETALTATFRSLPKDIRPALEMSELIVNYRALEKSREELRVETVLVRIRNDLSHGSRAYDADELDEAADVLERAVRAELLRLLGAPRASQERALSKPER